jgi:hypothetical protein
MSWHGTVHCNWCGEKGHNRRGCSARKKYVRQNPDSYEARLDTNQKRRVKASAQNRRCSYCKVKGHNRQTCTALKKDKVFASKKNKKFVGIVRQAMEQVGLGVGALVSKIHWNTDKPALYMVTDIQWDRFEMSCFQSYSRKAPIALRRLEDNSEYKMSVTWFDSLTKKIHELIGDDKEQFTSIASCYSYDSDNQSSVISPLSSEQVAKQIPKDFEKKSELDPFIWKDQDKYEERRYMNKDFVDKNYERGVHI